MTNNLKTGKEKILRILITIIRHDCSHGLNRRGELLSHDPTYPIEQNRTKNRTQSNSNRSIGFGNRTKSNTYFAVSSIFEPIEPI